MAWRINALSSPAMTQLGMNWGLTIGSLVIAIPMVWTVTRTSTHTEEAVDSQKTYFGLEGMGDEGKTQAKQLMPVCIPVNSNESF